MWFMFNVIALGILAGGWLLIKICRAIAARKFDRDVDRMSREILRDMEKRNY